MEELFFCSKLEIIGKVLNQKKVPPLGGLWLSGKSSGFISKSRRFNSCSPRKREGRESGVVREVREREVEACFHLVATRSGPNKPALPRQRTAAVPWVGKGGGPLKGTTPISFTLLLGKPTKRANPVGGRKNKNKNKTQPTALQQRWF